jgi:hypothetical protein
MRRIIASGLISTWVAGCAVSSVEPLTIPLAYQAAPNPQAVLVALSCKAAVRIQVNDKRAEALLGVRIHESKPLRAEVSAGGDPAAWVSAGVEHIMAQNGVAPAADGPLLNLDLNALRTSENVWHRSGYEARIVFAAALQAPSGKTCWQESVEGKAGNYGYSGSITNYQETLNSALDEATLHMLNSAAFNSALCHCGE